MKLSRLTVAGLRGFNEERTIDFDDLMPAVVAAGCPDDWWTIDLCFWPDAWKVTEKCKKAIDQLAKKYG